MPHTYDSLVDALADLKKRGYTLDFNLKENCIVCQSQNLTLQPAEFEIAEVHRFEGMSNPDDSSVLYAVTSNTGLKGVLVSAYGVYAEGMTAEMMEKLKR
ncbi:phosphoribosylpyrophosphate synthetase [Sphingobacteriales bacterium UPWRP_1]|nr:phosphoribosylpyrophosphate synthetase [Sphingobacteriales bacterium TSM_CSM]PSJ75247.1 phosphoribosylpyrophosphate synthetase [Sphingobacteriales bacterium UPWRP_1]